MPLSADMKARLRALTGADESATDDDLIAKLADEAELRGADFKAATEQVTALSAQVEAKDAQVLSLSANAPRTSPEDVSDYLETVSERREQAIAAGAISSAQAPMLDALISDGKGNPSVLALSAHGEGQDRRRFGIKFWKTIAKLAEGKDGLVRTGNAVIRASAVNAPTHGGDGKDDPAKAQEEAAKEAADWQARQLQQRGLSTTAA